MNLGLRLNELLSSNGGSPRGAALLKNGKDAGAFGEAVASARGSSGPEKDVVSASRETGQGVLAESAEEAPPKPDDRIRLWLARHRAAESSPADMPEPGVPADTLPAKDKGDEPVPALRTDTVKADASDAIEHSPESEEIAEPAGSDEGATGEETASETHKDSRNEAGFQSSQVIRATEREPGATDARNTGDERPAPGKERVSPEAMPGIREANGGNPRMAEQPSTSQPVVTGTERPVPAAGEQPARDSRTSSNTREPAPARAASLHSATGINGQEGGDRAPERPADIGRMVDRVAEKSAGKEGEPAQPFAGRENAGTIGARDAHAFGSRVTVVEAQSGPSAVLPAASASPTAAALVQTIDGDAGTRAFRAEAAGFQPAGNADGRMHSLKFQLQPAELGTVTVNLRAVAGQLSVEIQVDSAEAHQRLAHDADAIVRAMRSLGYDVDRVTVQQQIQNPAQGPAGGGARDASFAAPDGGTDRQGGRPEGRAHGDQGHGTGKGNGDDQRHRASDRGGLYI